MSKLNSEHEINIKAKMEDLKIEEEKLKYQIITIILLKKSLKNI